MMIVTNSLELAAALAACLHTTEDLARFALCSNPVIANAAREELQARGEVAHITLMADAAYLNGRRTH